MAGRRGLRGCMVAGIGAGLLLAGCAYDPYTGTYVPCCTYAPYPYPAYAYPAPAYAAPAPQPAAGDHLAQRFQRANVARDGMLTLQQAQDAGWQVVVRNFYAIDVARRGYVTLNDISAWLAARRQQGQGPPQ